MKRLLLLMMLLVCACGQEPSGSSGDGDPIDSDGPNDQDPRDEDDDDEDGPVRLCGNAVRDGDELCDGPPAHCVDLAAVWASGDAPCRADCSGYDVSACTPATQRTESVRPAERDPRWATARCNDGTTFQLEVEMATPPSKQWVIHLEGGGRCDGFTQSCIGRSQGLVSSRNAPADRAPAGSSRPGGTIMSRDPAVNPQFNGANFVYGNYCSSDLWVGTDDTPRPIAWKRDAAASDWVFTGRHNARALFEVLFTAYGLDDATSEVLVSGGSAGSAGVQMNVDLFASRLSSAIADGRVAMIAGAAFQGPFDEPGYSYYDLGLPDGTVVESMYAFYRAETDPRCAALAAARGLDVTACGPGPIAYAAATSAPPTGWGVRTLIAKNRLDQGPMTDYGIPVVAACTPQDLAARDAWLVSIDAALSDVRWLYAPADPQESLDEPNLHGLHMDRVVWGYAPPGLGGATLRDLVSEFWLTKAPDAAGRRMVFSGDVPQSSNH